LVKGDQKSNWKEQQDLRVQGSKETKERCKTKSQNHTQKEREREIEQEAKSAEREVEAGVENELNRSKTLGSV